MCYMNYLRSVDRGRVVGGLPDVVTIMEKKVVYLLLFPHEVFLYDGLIHSTSAHTL